MTQLLLEPQVWLSFFTLAVLEIVLGIDNIIFLTVLVDRLPERRRRSARVLGLGFAALTRIALLLSVVWLTRLRAPLFTWFDEDVSVRDLALFAGGVLLVVQSVKEIRDMLRQRFARRQIGSMRGYWLLIAQVGVIDIVFSFDTVFTAVGLSTHVEVMVAAILLSVLVMMAVSSAIGGFIDRYPTIKILALAFLVLVGIALLAESLHMEIDQRYLYFAMAFSAAVEALNIRLRRRG
ncbi:MAG TPA: TerC family protein [Steroidobacteraceae bacterium]|nr:TerC family protein [Steroidobacteraceae bacterium]